MYSIKVPAADGDSREQSRTEKGAGHAPGEEKARPVWSAGSGPGGESYVPSLALPLNIPTLRKYLSLGPLQRSWGPHTQLVEDKS